MRKRTLFLIFALLILLCSCGKKDVPISGKNDMNNTSGPTGEVNKPTDKTDIPTPTDTINVTSTPTLTGTPTSTPTPTEVLLPEGTKVMSVEEERFSALIPDYSTFKYVQNDGTYIYVADGEGIPYVYFNVLRDIPIGANQFLEESVIPSIQENYGERLYEMGSVYMEEDETTGLRIYGVPYRYDVSGVSVSAYVFAMEYKDVMLRITVKWVTGDDEAEGNVNEALSLLVESFRTDASYYNEENWSKVFGKITDDMMQAIPNETKTVKLSEYTEPNGYFNMMIPEGWVVKTGILPDYGVDLISYGIHVYDPDNPERQLYFNLSSSGFPKSQEAHDWYVKYYPNGPFALSPYTSDLTTAGFFRMMGECYGYYDFQVIDNLGTTPLNGDLLIANCIFDKNDKPMKGIFTGYVTSMSYMANSSPINIFSPMIDVGWTTVYTIIMETAGQNEFINWQPIFDRMFASIRFTDKFNREREEAWRVVMGTSYQMSETADAISDMISDSWEQRNKSTELELEKYSDALLGYSRVEDTDTGEIYWTDTGFEDRYLGERYKPITDEQYSLPTAGILQMK